MANIPSYASMESSAPCTNLQLTVSARKLKNRDLLSKSDPLCVLYQKEGRLTGQAQWKEKGRTEQIQNCLDPEWNQRFTIQYFFEERQQLMFEIYDIDNNSYELSAQDFLGRFECDLAEVVSAPGGCLTGNLVGLSNQHGTITISAEEIDDNTKENVQFHCVGRGLDKKDFFGKSDPFLNIYRIRPDGSRQLAHRTEVIKRNLNPEWKIFEVNSKLLCGGNRDDKFLIECFDYDWDGGEDSSSHDFIGSCETTVNRLLARTDKSLPLINAKKKAKKGDKYKDSGQLVFVNVNVIKQHSFLEFISGGTQLDFTVAVDFTASNGNVTNPASLHYISPHAPNQYEVAIRAVIDICQHYNNSKKFDAFGFGARVPPSNAVAQLFSLSCNFADGSSPQNFTQNPVVIGLSGVMQAYRHCLNKVTLYGPTNFAPVVNEAAKKAAQMAKDGSRYQILLIITDGVISDMARTKQAIIAASHLPLSIIIVGVGGDSFESMDELDSDNGLLSHEGRVAQRDIVQFVPMRNFLSQNMSNPQECERAMGLLAKEVLAEVPAQLTGYMKQKGLTPRPPDNPFPRDREEEAPVPYGVADQSSFQRQDTISSGQYSQGGYPPQQPFPPQGGGYPPSGGGYPPQGGAGGYPPYPQQPGYPAGPAPYPTDGYPQQRRPSQSNPPPSAYRSESLQRSANRSPSLTRTSYQPHDGSYQAPQQYPQPPPPYPGPPTGHHPNQYDSSVHANISDVQGYEKASAPPSDIADASDVNVSMSHYARHSVSGDPANPQQGYAPYGYPPQQANPSQPFAAAGDPWYPQDGNPQHQSGIESDIRRMSLHHPPK